MARTPANARVQALRQVHRVCDADDGEARALAPRPLKQVVQHGLLGVWGWECVGWVGWGLGGWGELAARDCDSHVPMRTGSAAELREQLPATCLSSVPWGACIAPPAGYSWRHLPAIPPTHPSIQIYTNTHTTHITAKVHQQTCVLLMSKSISSTSTMVGRREVPARLPPPPNISSSASAAF